MLESQGSVVLRWHFNQFGAYKYERPRHVTTVESQEKSLESLCNYATQNIREPVCLQTQMAPANETLTTNLTSCHYWGKKRIGVYTYSHLHPGGHKLTFSPPVLWQRRLVFAIVPFKR